MKNNSSLLTENQQSRCVNVSETGTTYRASGNLFIAVRTSKCCPKAFLGGIRSVIVGFSAGSGRRMRSYLRECLSDYKQMVTLTYPEGYPSDGRIVKEHLRRFLQELRREYERQSFIIGSNIDKHSSFWFLEFQSRGAPHFHIFTTWAPKADGPGGWVAKRWYEIVNSEDIRHLQAGTRVEFLRTGRAGTISYATKYAAKMEQKVCPENYENVGRWWGIAGRRSVLSAATWVSKEDSQNGYVLTTITAMFTYVRKQIDIGNIETAKREPGVVILIINSSDVMRKMRAYVSLLACKTMVWETIFNDAELDE